MATTLTDAAHASHPLDPEFVLAGRPLRPDCTLEQTSRFQDDVWRLGPAINSESSLLKILNFAHTPSRFRTTVKELFYAMLAGTLPLGEPRREIATVRGHFTAITRFLRWLDTWPAATEPTNSPEGTDPVNPGAREPSSVTIVELRRELVQQRSPATGKSGRPGRRPHKKDQGEHRSRARTEWPLSQMPPATPSWDPELRQSVRPDEARQSNT
jgi:hypothetical protein